MYFNKYKSLNLDIDLREMKGTFRKRYPGPEGGFLTYYWVKDYIKLNKVFPELWKLAPDFIFVAEIDGEIGRAHV